MAYTIKYMTMVDIIKGKCGYSTNKVLLVLRELTESLVKNIEVGNDIECLGLFQIKYTLSKKNNTTNNLKIYNNNLYDFKQQVKDISKVLDIEETDVRTILMTYYRTCIELLENGNQINVKSIGYIEPRYNPKTNTYHYFRRVSPSLVNKKTKKADFLLLTKNGSTQIQELSQKDLRYSMELASTLEEPRRVNEKEITI